MQMLLIVILIILAVIITGLIALSLVISHAFNQVEDFNDRERL